MNDSTKLFMYSMLLLHFFSVHVCCLCAVNTLCNRTLTVTRATGDHSGRAISLWIDDKLVDTVFTDSTWHPIYDTAEGSGCWLGDVWDWRFKGAVHAFEITALPEPAEPACTDRLCSESVSANGSDNSDIEVVSTTADKKEKQQAKTVSTTSDPPATPAKNAVDETETVLKPVQAATEVLSASAKPQSDAESGSDVNSEEAEKPDKRKLSTNEQDGRPELETKTVSTTTVAQAQTQREPTTNNENAESTTTSGSSGSNDATCKEPTIVGYRNRRTGDEGEEETTGVIRPKRCAHA